MQLLLRQTAEKARERIRSLADANAVVVFTLSRCCMGHVVKHLLFGLGVSPTIVELDHDASGHETYELLLLFQPAAAAGKGVRHHQLLPLPAIFIGGKFLGGVETLIACHINGNLVPLLKNAGALWL